MYLHSVWVLERTVDPLEQKDIVQVKTFVTLYSFMCLHRVFSYIKYR